MKKMQIVLIMIFSLALTSSSYAIVQDTNSGLEGPLTKSLSTDKKAQKARRALERERRARRSQPKKRTVRKNLPPKVVVADFESFPNNLGGNVGVFGAAEPDWNNKEVPHGWYYSQTTPGFTKKNVYRGEQSFRCVNGYSAERVRWATFSLDLGKVVDAEVIPIRINSLDVSGYRTLVMWVKGNKGGEMLRIFFRDARAPDYFPQVSVVPFPGGISNKWTKIAIPLDMIKENVDFTMLDAIGIEFGNNVGNIEGNIFYVDDVYFSNEEPASKVKMQIVPKQEDKAQ